MAQEEERRVVEGSSTRHEIVSRISQLIWLLAAILIALIAFRVLLKLLNANPNNDFASFVYNVTEVFLTPFVGLTSNPGTDSGVVLEVTSIIAMLVYALATFALVSLIRIIFDDSEHARVITYRRRRDE